MNGRPLILMRGGGDLATGVAVHLRRAGYRVMVTELPEPLVVRRTVSFAEAVFSGEVCVEGVRAVLQSSRAQALASCEQGDVAVWVCAELDEGDLEGVSAVVDARMLKKALAPVVGEAVPVIGLGPGFCGGINCRAAIETMRGAGLGEVLWAGSPQADTGEPSLVMGHGRERVLYAPHDGVVHTCVEIGDLVIAGQLLMRIDDTQIFSPFDGLVRGCIRSGLWVAAGTKLGDVDPRAEKELCYQLSDKANAVGHGVCLALAVILGSNDESC